VSGPSEVNSPLSAKERRAGLLDENAPGISEFHYPSLVVNEKTQSVLLFYFGDVLAERRLAYGESGDQSSTRPRLQFWRRQGSLRERQILGSSSTC
jgi:hypothetical protein